MTKDKWKVSLYEEQTNASIYILEDEEVVAVATTDEVAERIVQMHNSFDGLLEACKDILKYEKQNSGSSLRIERLEKAIAKSEE